jgi:hypothetical protein
MSISRPEVRDMRARYQDGFTTIRTEGAILPRDLLARIAAGDKDLGGIIPDAYHLSGEKLGEATTRAWHRLQGAWAAFRKETDPLRPEACSSDAVLDPGTSPTRERWLLPLFQELGYGRLPTAKARDIDGRAYAVSHAWGNVPIHLVGLNVDLDRRAAGVAGAAQASPHSLLQELLNRSDEHLWGFVSNGLTLRILRDNRSLTRQAYVEFDLDAMMTGEAYSDFALLYLLCHESRVEGERPEDCWLEKWSRAAEAQGTRALDQLRKGVEEAISALGAGFLAHAANAELRRRLQEGEVSDHDYYRDLLRLVYRLLFLFVAEDRGLLLDPGASPEAEDLYTRFYSTARLRHLAERRRGGRHSDLYQGLRLVMGKLGEEGGCAELGLPALGGFLFAEEGPAGLGSLDIANRDLLAAIRGLAFTTEGRVRRAVDYRNLGSEELGSVYEALLELHPEVNVPARTFILSSGGGSERKTSSSFYTPTALIQCLLDLALEPLVAEAMRGPDPEAAILDLSVCDPACGSGHFLVATAHRLAKRLAGARTGDEEPSPEAQRTALRDVIGHCLYGVDLNPMAVELCKVSLWMEALEPGKPLSFLDHRIVCGNSLIGTTPALLAEGIPDGAFESVEGDDKKVASALRKQNERERGGQTTLFVGSPPLLNGRALAGVLTDIDHLPDDSLAGVRAKEKRFHKLTESAEYRRATLAADAWCSAFMSRKVAGAPVITQDIVARVFRDTTSVPLAVVSEIRRLADEYRFLHWHLVFPEVFQEPRMGFDLMLGNPPWDTLSPDTKEFFARFDPQIRFAKKEEQQQIIEVLLEDEALQAAWSSYRRQLFSSAHFFKRSGRYQLLAPGNLGKGDFNVYRMFVETALANTRVGGYAAQVVPAGIYSGANAQAIRRELYEHWTIVMLVGLVNAGEEWFSGVDESTKFAVYAARRGGSTSDIPVAFGVATASDLAAKIAEPVLVPLTTVHAQSPQALVVPETLGDRDSDIASRMYSRWPSFGDKSVGEPYRKYASELHMGNDRDLFGDHRDYPDGLPVYEGRMVDHFDYRAKAYRSGRGRAAVWEPLPFGSPTKAIRPQWRLPIANVPKKLGDRTNRYRLAFCDVASPERKRSLVAALVPPGVICGHKVPTICFASGWEWAYMPWLAVANSLCIDYLVRKKIALSMALNVVDSLPFPRWSPDDPLAKRVGQIALRLTCTGVEMTAYWNAMAELGWCDPISPEAGPPGLVEHAARELAKAELEAIVAREVYGLSRDDLEFILDAFGILCDEECRRHGEYRTKRLVLDYYDSIELDGKGSKR